MNAPKKGLSPIAWIAIGCAGILIVGGIVVSAGLWFVGKKATQFAKDAEARPVETAAKLIALANPDVEFVSADEAGQKVTFREKKTGKEVTLDFADVQAGKIRFDGGEGEQEVTFSAEPGEGGGLTIESGGQKVNFGGGGGAEGLPDWVPIYPGAEVDANLVSSSDTEETGMVNLKGLSSIDEVLDHYAKVLADQGYKVERNQVSTGGFSSKTVSGRLDGDRRVVNVIFASATGQSTVTLQYSGKK